MIIGAKLGCSIKDGNGPGMARVERYHTRTHQVNGYKILPIPVPVGLKLYPCPYPPVTRTQRVPDRLIK